MGEVFVLARELLRSYFVGSPVADIRRMLNRLTAFAFGSAALIIVMLILVPVAIEVTFAFAPILALILLAAALFFWSKSRDKYR